MLAARHPEVEVVHHQHGHAHIAPRGVEQVRAADAGAAVADQDEDLQVGVGQLDARRVGQAAAVQAVERVDDEVLVAQPLAADIRDERDAVGIEPELDQRRIEMIQNERMPTAGAEGIVALVAIGVE